jgi:hypothetical protein
MVMTCPRGAWIGATRDRLRELRAVTGAAASGENPPAGIPRP